jgi:hypothetical protein
MALFRESDRRVFQRKQSERNPLVWCVDDSIEIEEAYTYQVKIDQLRDRLNLSGFTLQRAKEDFENCRAEEVERYKDLCSEPGGSMWQEKVSLYETTSLDDYINVFKIVQERKLLPEISLDTIPPNEQLLREILSEYDDKLYNFPHSDIRYLLRVFLESCPSDGNAIYDLTDIIHAGYYSETDEITNLTIQSLTEELPISGKIIVLTEGKTDCKILQQSIVILYPHLTAFFSFMDFENANVPGGTGNLATTVKAFAGTGILNRVVAIFDNDTAADEAIRSLEKVNLPSNIKILKLPDIEMAQSYPTLGPGGLSEMNINGLACSIELYLGRDVLTQNGELAPIQWTGYSVPLKKYQGVILDKDKLQKAFQRKADKCQINPEIINSTDWSEMKTIFKKLFEVFN